VIAWKCDGAIIKIIKAPSLYFLNLILAHERLAMKTRTLAFALAAVLGLTMSHRARADIELDFSNTTNSNIEFVGTGSGASFSFNNNSLGQGFQVTGSSNDGAGSTTADGFYGTLGGTYSYTTAGITTDGSGLQTAAVSTPNGTLSITDSDGVSLTGTVAGVDVSTIGTAGIINLNGVINLTAVSYSGTNADLQQLATEATASGGIVSISFQFAPGMSLTDLAASGVDVNTSYSGSIETVGAEPSSFAIVAVGALGMIGYGLRRRKTAKA
jgi:hypothetical protein